MWTTKFLGSKWSQRSKIVSQVRICIDDCVVKFSVITKELSSDSISLKYLLIRFVVMWFWSEHPIYFNLVEEWIEDLWNRITMNLWLWACWKSFILHVLCVLRLRRFVVEVHRGFRGLNPLSFTNLWFVEVSGGFWAWFQWTLRLRNMIWMIPLRMFFVFEDLWWKFFGALGLESVELHWFVVCWDFWRLFNTA